MFNFFSQILYDNELIGTTYAEPYAGGCGLALKLLFTEHVDRILINDLDYSIYSIWFSILNHNEEFCEWLNDVDVSIHNWNKYKNVISVPEDNSEIDIAKAAFFLNRTNVSGIIKGGPIGGHKQLGNYSLSVRFNKKDLINRIKRIHDFRDRIVLSNLNATDFIKKYNKKKQKIFFYFDPPYVKKGAELYLNYYRNKDHVNLCNIIKNLKSHWVISYDDNQLIKGLYCDFPRVIYSLSQSASNRVGKEILIFSKQINFLHSILTLTEPIIL